VRLTPGRRRKLAALKAKTRNAKRRQAKTLLTLQITKRASPIMKTNWQRFSRTRNKISKLAQPASSFSGTAAFIAVYLKPILYWASMAKPPIRRLTVTTSTQSCCGTPRRNSGTAWSISKALQARAIRRWAPQQADSGAVEQEARSLVIKQPHAIMHSFCRQYAPEPTKPFNGTAVTGAVLRSVVAVAAVVIQVRALCVAHAMMGPLPVTVPAPGPRRARVVVASAASPVIRWWKWPTAASSG